MEDLLTMNYDFSDIIFYLFLLCLISYLAFLLDDNNDDGSFGDDFDFDKTKGNLFLTSFRLKNLNLVPGALLHGTLCG